MKLKIKKISWLHNPLHTLMGGTTIERYTGVIEDLQVCEIRGFKDGRFNATLFNRINYNPLKPKTLKDMKDYCQKMVERHIKSCIEA